MLSDAPVFAYAPVTDLKKGRAFYEGILELKSNYEVEGVGISYRGAGDTALFMYLSQGAGTNEASTLFWAVDDVTTEVKSLQNKGVAFEEYDYPGMKTEDGIADSGDSKAAWFKDPFGNILAIVGN